MTQTIAPPSTLKRYFLDRFDRNFAAALRKVTDAYPKYKFPTTWKFNRDIDAVLNVKFWE